MIGYVNVGVSLQFCVLRLGFLQYRNISIRLIPEGEKLFVGGERPDSGGIGIRSLRGFRLQGIGASHSGSVGIGFLRLASNGQRRTLSESLQERGCH